MLTGRVTKLIPLSVKYFKEDKHFIDVGGSSLIAVQLKRSSDRLFIIPLNLGIILKFEQLPRLRTVTDYFSRYVGKIGKRTAEQHF